MLLFILPIAIINSAWATSCDDMRRDLMAIELKLQNSCEKPTSGGGCCALDGDKSCHTKKDLEAKYNETLSQLIIAEGLTSIGMAMQSNHNALNDLDKKTISKAEKYIDAFENNIDKAEFLDLAFNARAKDLARVNVFSGYNGNTQKQMHNHLSKICSKSSDKSVTSFNGTKFCNRFSKVKGKKKYKALLKTITGFYNADNEVSQDQNDDSRNKRYKDYASNLLIQVNNQANNFQSPNQFKNNKTNSYTKIKELKTLLSDYKKKKSPILAKHILQRAQKIDDIKVNYNLEKTSKAEVKTFFENDLNTPLVSVLNKKLSEATTNLTKQQDLPSLLLEGGVKDNFIAVASRLRADIHRQELAVKSEVKKALANIPTKPASCTNSAPISCLKTICKNKIECYAGRGTNLKQFYQQVDSLEKHQKANQNISKASACLKYNNKTLKEKMTCLEQIPTSGKTNLAKLRKQLQDWQIRINKQNQSKRFQLLNSQKGMALHGLNSNYCRSNTQDKVSYSLNKTDCGTDKNIVPDYEALSLAVDGQNLMISLNYQEGQTRIHKAFIDSNNSEDIKDYRKELIQQCRGNKANTVPHLCEYYEDKLAWDKRIKEEKYAIAHTIDYNDGSEEEEFNPWTKGATSFLKSFVSYAPVIGNSYQQLNATKTKAYYDIAAIEYYDPLIIAERDRIREMINKPPSYQWPTSGTSNWGNQNMGYDYNSLSSFQFNQVNSNTVINNQQPMNFNFTPIPTTVTGSSTNSTNNAFQFSF